MRWQLSYNIKLMAINCGGKEQEEKKSRRMKNFRDKARPYRNVGFLKDSSMLMAPKACTIAYGKKKRARKKIITDIHPFFILTFLEPTNDNFL